MLLFQFLLVLVILAAVFWLVMTWAPKGWRTVIFNAVASVPVIGAQLADALGGFDWTKVLAPQNAAWAGLALLMANIILRSVTTSPVGKTI